MDTWEDVPTKTEAYETLTETARKWREILQREKLQGSHEQENQGAH